MRTSNTNPFPLLPFFLHRILHPSVPALFLTGILMGGNAVAQTAIPAAPAPAITAPASPAPAATPDTAKTAKPAKAKKAKAKAPAADSAKTAEAAAKDTVQGAAPALKDSIKTASADSVKAVPAPVVAADSTKPVTVDSLKALPSAVTSVDSNAYADSAQTGGKKKRKRVVRETTVNTIDELKGRYRSPKKALFMSMIVPGLGQAYVGQNWFNYTRGAAYFLTDVALAYGWHHYVVDRQDAQIAKYRKYADENWRQYKYEDSIARYPDKVANRNLLRENYCEYVQEANTNKGNSLLQGCKSPLSGEYDSFKREYNDRDSSAAAVALLRSSFPNPHNFYELIGKETEFITGWLDADSVFLGDSAYYAMGNDGNALKDAAGHLVLATTDMQQKYIGMRAQANDYARMQAWFLGGMVVNHIVSAIDAALAAHYHNKALYQTETNWWDRVRLDSYLAWDGYAPAPTVTASVTF
ncbi:MAG: hypothetical protein ABIW76_07260 [Fibrobacteria bacterium]